MKTTSRHASGFMHLFLMAILPFSLLWAQKSHPISVNQLKAHTSYLSSDDLAGRAVGSEGELLAAKYLVNRLKDYSVSPPPGSEGYFQRVPLMGIQPQTTSKLVLKKSSGDFFPRMGEDYLVVDTGNESFLPKPIPMVFVRYGISAPEFGYDDFASVSVRGKIVVVMAGEPQSKDPNFFNGPQLTVYSEIKAKQRMALSRGAIGTIVIADQRISQNEWAHIKQEYSFEDVRTPFTPNSHLTLLVHPKMASEILGCHPDLIRNISSPTKFRAVKSRDLDCSLIYRGKTQTRTFLGQNVLGFVEGTDPDLKDQYLIVSAHYDHLGVGMPVHGDSIYNGLVDNAIGVAAALEIARLASLFPPQRSILFLFTTAEEKGMLGTLHYLDNPLLPLENAIANINIDGLSIFDEVNDMIGIGSHFSTLGTLMEEFAGEQLMSAASPESFADIKTAFIYSDQYAFAQAGIPSMLIVEGKDYHHLTTAEADNRKNEWQANYYHSPQDDLTQPINWDAVLQHVNFIKGFTLFVANHSERPRWYMDGPFARTSN